jgi:hypothetical protein
VGGVVYFFTLVLFSVELLVFYWPALLAILMGFVGLSLAAIRDPTADCRVPLRWCSIQLLVPLAILLAGVLLRWEGPDDVDPPQWPVYLINGLLWAHAPFTVGLVLALRNILWFVLSVSVVVLGFSLSAAVVSCMSVTGDWM